MSCHLSEEELWSGLDREAPEILAHLTTCEACRLRAEEFQTGMSLVRSSGSVPPRERKLPRRIGPYVITRFLGEGGMGIVYEGRQQTPDRLVAVKVMRGGEHVDETRIRLFLREAQTLARLKHPWIAAIYEAGWTDDRQPFFVMELVEGPSLKQHADDQKLPLRKRLELFRRVCEPIAHAHQRGVIHRDLKPSNILIDEAGNPKVLDFGLARIMDSEVARSSLGSEVGKFIGTLPYMSPEAVQGDIHETDVRSDVYSLGVVLYELLTGVLPHAVTRTRLADSIRIICEDLPATPSTHSRALRGDLDTIILKALEKAPERRYQSVNALADDIERYLTNQPITARKSNVVYEVRKLIARHRGTVVFAALIVLVTALARGMIDRTYTKSNQEIQLEKQRSEVQQVIDLLDYTKVLHAQGGYEAADRRYRRVLASASALQHEGRHRLMAVCWQGLGSMLVEWGEPDRLDEASDLLDKAMAYYESLGGSGESNVKEIRGWQLVKEAQAAQFAGNAARAEDAYRQVLTLFRDTNPEDLRHRARARLGLASLFVQLGDAESSARAAQELRETLAAYQSDTLRQGYRVEYDAALVLAAINEARRAQFAGERMQAELRFRKALDDAVRTSGNAHRFTNWARLGLGSVLVEGQVAEGRVEGEELLLLARQVAGSGPYVDRITLVNVLEVLRGVYAGRDPGQMEKKAEVLEELRALYAAGAMADEQRHAAVIGELKAIYGPEGLDDAEAIAALRALAGPRRAGDGSGEPTRTEGP